MAEPTFQELLRDAHDGVAYAQCMVGFSYMLGEDVLARDLPTAALWLEKAARQGFVTAEGALGDVLIDMGQHEEGLTWLRLAAAHGDEMSERRLLSLAELDSVRARAEQGDAECQFALAEHYDFDPPKDLVLAELWYRKAAVQGVADAQNSLAELLLDRGSAPEEALRWLRAASAQGQPDALVTLGVLLFEGELTPQDRLEARRCYQAAARLGEPKALYNLGQMYRRGEGAVQSWARALVLYRQAAEIGHERACYWLAQLYGGEEEGCPLTPDPATAVHWLERGAALGDADCQADLAVAFHEGRGVARDYVRAAELYRAAAKQGDGWSQYLLGLCYRDGQGVKSSRSLARHWLRKAAASQPEAARALRDLPA